MQKLGHLINTLISQLRSPGYFLGFATGALVFALGFFALDMYNQSNGFTTLEVIAGEATFYHPAVISAALEWPCGFPITCLLVAISVGFLGIKSHWAKPVGIFLLVTIIIAYLVIMFFMAAWANIQGSQYFFD